MIIVECPHCKCLVEIEQVNCAIFRHATFRDGNQVDPHASKEQCELWVQQEQVVGCAKPFELMKREDGEWQAVHCEYK